MSSVKNILVCPLDWGLGHATRIVPVINELIAQGANVIMGADNRPLDFLMRYYPDNTVIKLEGFNPVYPEKGSMAWKMIKSVPKMISASKAARRSLQRIIKEHNIHAIISDNRYELCDSGIPSVFVTHQLNIQTNGIQSIAKPFINLTLSHFLGGYDEIWIPDSEDHGFSGKLSRTGKYRSKIHFIGTLSRFSNQLSNKGERFDILAIMSGPEPQRSLFERIISQQATKTDKKVAILQGRPGFGSRKTLENITYIPHAADDDFAWLLKSSEVIISRPGYSTLMDLAVFEKSGIFIPTPGQTEQEYLASKLNKERKAVSYHQNHFNLKDAIRKSSELDGLITRSNDKNLKKRITHLLNNC